MDKCIYCLGTKPNSVFSSRDHIFLRSLGGQKRLPTGCVCDQCNNAFSSLEKRFIRDSFISLPKQFVGPTGRHGPFKSRLHVVESHTDGKMQIGYIEQGGIPRTATQIQINSTPKWGFAIDETCSDTEKEIQASIESLRLKKDKVIYQFNEKLSAGCPILVFFEGKVFAFLKNEQDVDILGAAISKILDKDRGPDTFDEGAHKSSQVTNFQELSFNLDEINRVGAKMAFNALANFFGQEFALNSGFNKLRNYIKTGEKEIEFVTLQESGLANRILRPHMGNIIDSDNFHAIAMGRLKDDIVSIVCFYGQNLEFVIRSNSSIDWSGCTMPIRVFINKFKTHDEFELFDRVAQINSKVGGENSGL